MSHEAILDAGRILLGLLVVFAAIGLLRDAGLTGFSTAALPAPRYIGPETIFALDKSQITIDLNYYFSGTDLQYFISTPASIDAQLFKSILFIKPEHDGEYSITLHVSNEQTMAQQKLNIKASGLEPKRSSCSCQGS